MMEGDFLSFQTFADLYKAKELTDLLDEHGIPYEIADESVNFDVFYKQNETNNEYGVKLKKEDFGKAKKLYEGYIEQQLSQVDKDYDLFQYSDKQLLDILKESERWSLFDVLLARKILAERGNAPQAGEVEKMRNQEIDELQKPKFVSDSALMWGFLIALLGGIFAIYFGHLLYSRQKLLPNGEIVYVYSEKDRKLGKGMFQLGLVFMFAWIYVSLKLKGWV